MKKPTFIAVHGQPLDKFSIVSGRVLPHTGPAVLIDGVVQFNGQEDTASIATVTELWEGLHCFIGHFPGKPVCPGHIMLEMANLTAALFYFCLYNRLGVVPMIRKHAEINYHGQAVPGDILRITCTKPVTMRQHFFSCAAEIRNQRNEPVLSIDQIVGAAVAM